MEIQKQQQQHTFNWSISFLVVLGLIPVFLSASNHYYNIIVRGAQTYYTYRYKFYVKI